MWTQEHVSSQIFLCEEGVEVKSVCPSGLFTAFSPPSHWSIVLRKMRAEITELKSLISEDNQSQVFFYSISDKTLCWQNLKASILEFLNKNDLMVHHQIKVLSTIPWFHNFSFCLVANYRLIKLGIAGKAVKGRKCTSVQISHFTCGEMKVSLHCTCADRSILSSITCLWNINTLGVHTF